MHVPRSERGAIRSANSTDEQQRHHSELAGSKASGLERLSYGVAEAAAVTGLSRSKLYELIQSGELPSLKIGSRRLLTRVALVALLDRAGGVAAEQ